MDKKLIEVLTKIVEDPYFYILTNIEIYDAICDELGDDYISFETFKSWSAGRRSENSENYNVFARLMSRAKTKQKINILKKLEKDEKAWQRYAWILERKYKDFNKIDKSDNKNKNEHSGEVKITRETI